MKKLFLMSLVALVSMAFTACGDDDKDSPVEPVTPTAKAYAEYTINIADEFVKYYDVTATYTTLDGTTVEEKITTGNVTKRIEKSGTGADVIPQLVVSVVRNSTPIEVVADQSYTLIRQGAIVGVRSNGTKFSQKSEMEKNVFKGAKMKEYMDTKFTSGTLVKLTVSDWK